jgi:hypothetical protein
MTDRTYYHQAVIDRAALDDECATLRNALRHIIDRHDAEDGDAVTVQIARKALGS